MTADPRPIGVFDSGLGGLTVARALRARAPTENLVYLGDTARVPYGTRSPETVLRYARRCAAKLMEHDVKLLVVACNTVSAVAVDMLRVELDVPVIGVVSPGARAGVRATRRGALGVIATAGTVRSGAYVRAVAAESTRVQVTAVPAPLLVPLVEEGWLEGEVPRLVARRYLEGIVAAGCDALILGCTHYPLVADVIRKELADLAGAAHPVVDSAEATAEEVESFLRDRGLAAKAGEGRFHLAVTDLPEQFTQVATRFLGGPLDEELVVEQVDL